ncbi:MAG: hypothetical protein RLZZ77_2044 [Bacteroidota bacterium]
MKTNILNNPNFFLENKKLAENNMNKSTIRT